MQVKTEHGWQTQPEEEHGFLNQAGDARLARVGSSYPRACRHCGAESRWMGRHGTLGFLRCTGGCDG